MAWLSQIIAVSTFSLLSLPQRLGSSVTALVGITGVVAVMIGVLSIAQGILQTMNNTASPTNAIVLRSGSDSEMVSGVLGSEADVIAEAPGVARSDSGPLASPEVLVIIDRPKRSTGTDANVPLRGVTRTAFEVRHGIEIVEGRMFRWGLNEVIVGQGAAIEFTGLDVGSSLTVGSEVWPVVGIFQANGGLPESEIWMDSAVVQQSYQRGDTYQSVSVKLETPESFQGFKDALTSDPRLNVTVKTEGDYYADQSSLLYNLVTGLGTLIAVVMSLGAIFGHSIPCTLRSRPGRRKLRPCGHWGSTPDQSWFPSWLNLYCWP